MLTDLAEGIANGALLLPPILSWGAVLQALRKLVDVTGAATERKTVAY